VKEYGADEVIDYRAMKFEDVVKNVDAVLDTVGADVQQRSYGVLKEGGTLVAVTQPPSAEEAATHKVNASMLVTQISTGRLETVARMIDAGEIKPFVGMVRPLSEVAEVWRDIQTGHVDGKVVFTVGR
jgi:NADPH:quinone reductase-like Zn-dependent oxidoreductase